MERTEKLLNLKIHKISAEQYKEKLDTKDLDSTALYLTPEEPLPEASTERQGIVQLYDNIDSTATDKAATANAVKQAYDTANHTHPYLLDTTKYAASSEVGGAANKVANSITFSVDGNGTETVATFDGSSEVSISYNTIGAAPAEHNHGLKDAKGTTTYPILGIDTNNNHIKFTDITAAGDGTFTATSFNASSDRRLKENLVAYEPEKSILDLPIYSFNFKNNPDKTQIGCMAQDLQELFPELVTEGSDGYLSINENKLVYLLLLELKKMKAKLIEAGIMEMEV